MDQALNNSSVIPVLKNLAVSDLVMIASNLGIKPKQKSKAKLLRILDATERSELVSAFDKTLRKLI
ncbi:MAG: hypothetical protein WC536_04305 [Patescibacteria group bacterium]